MFAFRLSSIKCKLFCIFMSFHRSTAMVVVAFIASGDMRVLLEELDRAPPPPRQWIGSESWVTDTFMVRYSFCAGAIGVAIPQSVIPGLRDFLLGLSPSEAAASPLLTEFWEDAFNCSLTESELLILLLPFVWK